MLLLDEIEKAHPDLYNILLQVMDHGKLTDHNGKQINFRNVILIMTTNAGAADMAKAAFGFTRTKREGEDIEAINRMFAPEFRNRLDAVVPFGRLPTEVIAKVVDKFVMQLEAQLADRHVTIELSDEARDWLVERGYDEAMGARPMARVIQTHIKTPLADEVLFGRLKHGGTVRVVVSGEGVDAELGLRLSRRPGSAAARQGDRGEEAVEEGQGRARTRETGGMIEGARPGPGAFMFREKRTAYRRICRNGPVRRRVRACCGIRAVRRPPHRRKTNPVALARVSGRINVLPNHRTPDSFRLRGIFMSDAFATGLDRNDANFAALTPISFLNRAAFVFPQKPSVVYGDRRFTWKETAQRCRRLASALRKRGIGKNDTVAAMLPNVPALFEVAFRRRR